MPDTWSKLHDGETYKVYYAPGGWWDLFRYTVAKPSGEVLTFTATRWGAKFAIGRAIQRDGSGGGNWRDAPIVDEVEPGSDR